jgi:hypothetical protein
MRHTIELGINVLKLVLSEVINDALPGFLYKLPDGAKGS